MTSDSHLDALRSGQGAEPVGIWPGVAPGSEGWSQEEFLDTDPVTGTLSIRGVVRPTITPVLPRPGTSNGTGVIIAPGGAFTALAWEHEGLPMARWFAERGVAAFVLKYRLAVVPADPTELAAKVGPMPDPSDRQALREWGRAALGRSPDLATADGEQAVRTVRAQADTWDVDPSRVGILGFSAGATVATQVAATTDATARPAFVANIYGTFFERPVPADAPPYFGVIASDDGLCLDDFLHTSQLWIAAGAPTEIHVYETGSHGFGLRPQGSPVDAWTTRLADWLATRELITSSSASN
jgi:acetyl esterase/lipase